MGTKIKVGIIGYGLAGRVFHAPLISSIPDFEITKIRTTDKERSKMITDRYPGTEVVEDEKLIIEDPEINLVIVASPNPHHFSQANAALHAGKHVVIDKPFAIASKEADELISLAKKKDLVLTAFQNRRWDADFLTVKQVLESDRLGIVVEAEIHYDRFRNFIKPDTWKEDDLPGGGILYDLGSHLVDQALVLFGLPKAVTAILLQQRENARTADNFEIILHYPAKKVTLKAGMLVRGKVPRYILLGNYGSFIKYGLDVQESQLNEGILPGNKKYGLEDESAYGLLTIDKGDSGVEEIRIESLAGNYPAYYQNIYEAINAGKELIVKPAEARNTVRLIELAVMSNDQKKTIPWSH